jgi:hypothetical protein
MKYEKYCVGEKVSGWYVSVTISSLKQTGIREKNQNPLSQREIRGFWF